MGGRLFNQPAYRYAYQPTHEGIHRSLLKYAEEHADESLEHLKLESPTVKEIKKTIIAKTRS
jgi:hypothetical protein